MTASAPPLRLPWTTRRAWVSALIAFALLRLLTAVTGVIGNSLTDDAFDWTLEPYHLRDQVLTAPPPLRTLIEPWYRWDTGWYTYLALNGYQPDHPVLAFPPLYALLIRLVQTVVGDGVLAALLISSVCTLLLFGLLYTLVAEDYGDTVATVTLILLASYPGGLWLMAGYTESLFLTLIVGAWLAAKRYQWVLAGLLGLAAGLTRAQGWVLALPLAYYAASDLLRLTDPTLATLIRSIPVLLRQHAGGLLRRAPAVIAPGLGTLIYLLIILPYGSLGEQFARYWNVRPGFPGESLLDALSRLVRGDLILLEGINLLVFLAMIGLALAALRRLRPAYLLYAAATLLVIAMYYSPTRALDGMLRYMLHLFPLLIVLAMAFVPATPWRRRALVLWVGLAVLFQSVLVILYVNWVWLG